MEEQRYTLNLYATWTKIVTMQNWDGCDRLKEHQIVYLKDARDNSEYKVAKLKDGKCWMIDNLRLGYGVETDKTLKLDNTTSDITADEFLLKMTPSNFDHNIEHSEDFDVEAAYVNDEFGGYYSWGTATAGTGAAIDYNKTHDATGSICPKGWRLPTGGANGELEVMANLYSDTGILSSPIPHFLLMGLAWNDGRELSQINSEGSCWSSTGINKTSAYRMIYFKGDVHQDSEAKFFGLSVRCIARE